MRRSRILVLGLLVLFLLAEQVPAGHAAVGTRWVRRDGATLTLAGVPWRFSGVNMYWLGLDDNLPDGRGPTWPTKARIDSGFAAAKALGATVVRAHTLGTSVGCPRCLEPARGVFNDAAFRPLDDALAAARRNGIRLMIPLTDQWDYYHGGKRTFTRWRGYADDPAANAATSAAQRASEAHFYTDPVVVADFRAYVAHLLDHVVPDSGRRLRDDPVVAVWETGNELWDAPVGWTAQIARYLSTLAPDALVADGSAATGKRVADAAVDVPEVDLVGGHSYPTDADWCRTDAAVAAAHGKAYVVGEYPVSGPGVTAFQRGLAADRNVAGALAWTLLPWTEAGVPEPHGDGYAFHWPGATAAEQVQGEGLRQFAAGMRTTAPTSQAAVAYTTTLSR